MPTCPECGVEFEKSRYNQIYCCYRCKDRAKHRRPKNKKQQNDTRYIRRLKRLEEDGICARCGVNKVKPGHTRCQECLDKRMKYYYAVEKRMRV